MRPIHTMSSNIEEQFCRTLLKAHLGTGTDYLSKIEKKKSSLKGAGGSASRFPRN